MNGRSKSVSKVKMAHRGPGRPGGDVSRSRILYEAGQLFSRDGFDAVTIRNIAAKADVNLAAIGYHFGGKKGLYHAVIGQIIVDVTPIIHPLADKIRSEVAAVGDDRDALAGLAAQFVRYTLTSILSSERLRWQHALLMRELSRPSDAFPTILDGAINPLHDAVCVLVGAATGKDADDAETRLLTTDVVGQCMVYEIARTLVCARMGWQEYTDYHMETLIAMVTGAVQRTLGLPDIGGRTETGRASNAAKTPGKEVKQ
jgi:AcrR family transcriptional regulator